MTDQERTAELAEEVKEFLGLARLATRGPWGWGSQKKSSYDELMEGRFLFAHGSVDYEGEEREANGEFITAAREFADSTLPRLLARLEKQAAALALTAPAAALSTTSSGDAPLDLLAKAHFHGWLCRERLEMQGPGPVQYPAGLDYEEQQDFAFQQFLSEARAAPQS